MQVHESCKGATQRSKCWRSAWQKQDCRTMLRHDNSRPQQFMKNKNLFCITDMQWSCKTWVLSGFEVTIRQSNQLKRRKQIFQHYCFPKKQPKLRTVLWNSSDFRRSEMNSKNEAAQIRNKWNCRTMVQSRLQESWWAETMEFRCSL